MARANLRLKLVGSPGGIRPCVSCYASFGAKNDADMVCPACRRMKYPCAVCGKKFASRSLDEYDICKTCVSAWTGCVECGEICFRTDDYCSMCDYCESEEEKGDL